MKSSGRGYTILEVMIFLAITSALFISAWFMMSGQQTRAQFSQGMRDVESKVRDYINDVSTGYYPQVGEYTCNAPTGSPVSFSAAAAGTDSTGTNLSCIFLGKALQFKSTEGADRLLAYSVVGRRKVNAIGSNRDVQTIVEATPTAVYDTDINLDKTEVFDIPWGVKVDHITNTPAPNAYMVGLYSSLSRSATVTPGQSESGALTLQPVIYNLNADTTRAEAVQCINGATASCDLATLPALESMEICFRRADDKEEAVLIIGGEGKTTNLKLEFRDCTP